MEIFIQYNAFYNKSAAAILSVPLLLVVLFLLNIQRRRMKGRSYVNISAGYSSTRLVYHLGKLKIPGFCFVLFIVTLSVALPLVVLIKSTGTFSTIIRVLNSSWETLTYSLLLAGAGAFITLLLAFPIAYRLERWNSKMKPLFEYAALAPLAVPAAALGIGLIHVWNQPILETVYTSSLIVIFGYIGRFIPLAFLINASAIKQISPDLEQAAALVTTRQSTIISQIVIPLARKSMIIGFFFVFILSMGELATTLLVIPPGKETLPIRIYNLMHYGAEEMVAALCLIQVVVILTLASLLMILYRKIRGYG